MKLHGRPRLRGYAFTGILLLVLGILAILIDARIRPYGGYNFGQYEPSREMFIAFASVISVATLLVAVNRSKNVGRIGVWYSLFLLSLLAWGLGDGLARSAPNAQLYLGWVMLAYVGLILMCPLFLLFVLSYTQNDRLLYRWTTLAVLLFSGASLLYVIGEGKYLVQLASYTTHNAVPGRGPLNLLNLVYLQIAYLAGTVMLFRYWRRLKDVAARRQARLMFFGILVTVVGGSATDSFLPLFGIEVPSTALLFTTLATFIFSYSIFHYGMSAYDPAALAATIVRSVTEGLVVIDNRGVILQINTAAAVMLRTTLEEATGSQWHTISRLAKGNHDYQPEERPDYITKSYDEIREFGRDDNIYLVGKRFRVPVAMTITPLQAGTGNGAVIVFRDITKEKEATATIEHKVEERTAELHRTQTQLMASVNSLKQGYIMTDHQGAVLTMNHAASMLFCPDAHSSYDHEETCTMERVIAAFKGTLNLQIKVATALERKKQYKFTNVAMGAKFFHIYISPIVMDNNAIGTTILVDDVTEERILDRSKDEFFSIASHELRTPLTIIRGNAKMIDQLYAAELKDKNLKLMISDIYESSVRLIEIVNDFLDVSRLEQGKIMYQLAPLAIDRAVESVVYEMGSVAKQRGISMTMHKAKLGSLPPVYADADRVKQVLYNLIGNALKFTDTGTITIDFALEKRHIKVLITDTGRGITEENKNLLFHKFQQASDSLLTRDPVKGTGLGLYISKLLAEAMGGKTLLEETQPGKGSTFSFSLPIATKRQLKDTPPQKPGIPILDEQRERIEAISTLTK